MTIRTLAHNTLGSVTSEIREALADDGRGAARDFRELSTRTLKKLEELDARLQVPRHMCKGCAGSGMRYGTGPGSCGVCRGDGSIPDGPAR